MVLNSHWDKSHTSEYFHFVGANIRDDSCACEEQLPSTQNVVASLKLPMCAPFHAEDVSIGFFGGNIEVLQS